MFYLWLAVGVAVVAAITLGVTWAVLRQRQPVEVPEPTLSSARDLFQIRREMLEARFLTLASQSGKPRDLTWVDCGIREPCLLCAGQTYATVAGVG